MLDTDDDDDDDDANNYNTDADDDTYNTDVEADTKLGETCSCWFTAFYKVFARIINFQYEMKVLLVNIEAFWEPKIPIGFWK